MKQSILVATAIALMLSGCGDKDESTPQESETTSMLEKAGDMGMEMKDKAAEAGSDAMEATQDAASSAKDAASSAMESVGDTVESATESAKDMGTELMDKARDKAGAAMSGMAGMTGMADTDAPETMAADTEMDAEQVALGKKVFSGNCFACHGTGVAGAPKLGDKAAWAPRIKQGMNTLVEHSLAGFKGTTGYMPPKGGFTTLSDDEVSAAVAYMVDQAS